MLAGVVLAGVAYWCRLRESYLGSEFRIPETVGPAHDAVTPGVGDIVAFGGLALIPGLFGPFAGAAGHMLAGDAGLAGRDGNGRGLGGPVRATGVLGRYRGRAHVLFLTHPIKGISGTPDFSAMTVLCVLSIHESGLVGRVSRQAGRLLSGQGRQGC